MNIPVVLWAYCTTYKQLTRQTPFKLVYGQVAIMHMEYIVPSLWIAVATHMDNGKALEEHIL